MKAKVKHNGEIIDVIQVGTKTHLFDINNVELIDAPVDYWEKLKHQYAGMAMQGILSNQEYVHSLVQRVASREILNLAEGITKHAEQLAHALVEKMKNNNNNQ